jgi:hypothetical protein
VKFAQHSQQPYVIGPKVVSSALLQVNRAFGVGLFKRRGDDSEPHEEVEKLLANHVES